MMLSEPNFIDRDPQKITQELVAHYEQLTGKTLYPAQVERVLIDILAYRESIIRIGIQEAAKQNLLAYARAPMLDYLGELMGVSRLPAQAASTRLQVELPAIQLSSFVLPRGSKVQNADGSILFETLDALLIPAGQLSAVIDAQCITSGEAGNGWQIGQINGWFDYPGIDDVRVHNLTVSEGGSDFEDDEHLRESIRLAPESFSNAGSMGAYRYHVLRTHQSIIDVTIDSPKPGYVDLYPLTKTGLPNLELLSLVQSRCSADRVRPLTDSVEARTPTAVPYEIRATLQLYSYADPIETKELALTAVNRYVAERSARLGMDIVLSQLIAVLQVQGVYQVLIQSPQATLIKRTQWASCQGVHLTLIGANDE